MLCQFFFHFFLFLIKGRHLYCFPHTHITGFSSWFLGAISAPLWSNTILEERCYFYSGKGRDRERDRDRDRQRDRDIDRNRERQRQRNRQDRDIQRDTQRNKAKENTNTGGEESKRKETRLEKSEGKKLDMTKNIVDFSKQCSILFFILCEHI